MSKLSKALIAAAGNSGGAGLTVEDVFSTYLYTGTGADQTITNNIDLSGEGGLTWIKGRDTAYDHRLFDTDRGAGKMLSSNNTGAEQNLTEQLEAFNADGFQVGNNLGINGSGSKYASWTFRKAEKFFDVVTYTGNGTAGRTVAHNLGSVPACMIVKRTNAAQGWAVYHVGMDATNPENWMMRLNATSARFDLTPSRWNDTAPTSTDFTLSDNDEVNGNGDTYVAYLFASDAGGFGDDGSESIIKCGSYNSSNTAEISVNVGFEPQFIIYKDSSAIGEWYIQDVMRGNTASATAEVLRANNSAAEYSSTLMPYPTSTGFNVPSGWGAGNTYIYIAIRRPMKTPESGTEVFKPSFRITGDPTVDTGFVTDMGIVATRTGGGTSDYHLIGSRLTGNLGMTTTSTSAEVSRGLEPLKWDYNDGWGGSDTASSFAVWYSFKRATGFFDVVAYTGDGVAGSTQSHNLGVAPECMIVKRRDGASSWITYWDALGATKGQFLDNNQAFTSSSYWNDTAPTATQLTLGSGSTNNSGATFIAYLFATLAGVSKVGSYTGTGADLNVDCGFSAGARFILIKRTDSTGDWYVWDSVRGIVAGNDPYLLLNSTAAEVTTTDYIDPLASGFTVTSSAPAALNASGGSFVYLAIA